MTYNTILMGSKRASHAVSRPTSGTPAVQKVPSTSGVCVNRVLAHTATSKCICLRAGSFSLEVSVEDFIRERWLSIGEPRKVADWAFYFHHLASWWPHRNNLLMFYEDLKECYESSVHSVAEFMGITDEHCIQVALERGIFEFMKQYSDKFSMKLFEIAAMCSVAY